MDARWPDWPQDLAPAERREFVALEAFGGPDDGPPWRWRPEPGVTLVCRQGRRRGGGPKFIVDPVTGGGVLQERSKVTMRWRNVATVTPHSA